MRKPISNMTAQEFIEAKAALNLNRKGMAEALNRSGPSITGYENGNPIPVDVAVRLQDLLKQTRERIQRSEGVLLASVGSMIVYQNERKRPTLHQTQGRFFRRQREQDTRVLGVYRMSVERYLVFAEALARWHARVQELARQYTDEARQRDYRLELTDIKAMAENAPRHAPYDLHINRCEWPVVSRALRHLAATGTKAQRQTAEAIRCHWNRYKVTGYPRHRT